MEDWRDGSFAMRVQRVGIVDTDVLIDDLEALASSHASSQQVPIVGNLAVTNRGFCSRLWTIEGIGTARRARHHWVSLVTS